MTIDFPTTRWSLVLEAKNGDSVHSREALAELYRAYWKPLYAYLRASGRSRETSQDMVQAFFAHLLDREGLQNVNPEKGHFRSFLLTALRHLLTDEHRRATALKRGAGKHDFSLDVAPVEGRLTPQAIEGRTPETLYERQWALTVVEQALERLQRTCDADGCVERFDLLKPYINEEPENGAYEDAGRRLGLSLPAVRQAVHRLRRRFGRCLREEIGQTVAGPQDVDGEVRHLLQVLRDPG